MQTYKVTCLEDNIDYYYISATPYEALFDMKYFINLSEKCDAEIHKTESGEHLYFEHNGKTYVVKN